MKVIMRVFWIIVIMVQLSNAGVYYVATSGSDTTGDGSSEKPWATIGKAVSSIPDDGSTIIVRDGLYTGNISISRQFNNRTIIRAENSYKARLTNTMGGNIKVVYITGSNITFKGFEIFNQGTTQTNEYLIHIEGNNAHDIVMENNIIHDNIYNDMMKINAGAHNVTIQGNVMYNPDPNPIGVQHMDVNTVYDIVIQDNIFFHDYPSSDQGKASSFIVIKNSAGCGNLITKNHTVQRNIFLNYQGKSDQPFLLLGEDGLACYEVQNALIQSNLFIGNPTGLTIEAAFGIKGCKDITFRANTIVGDFQCGSWAFAHRINREGSNLVIQNVYFYNNIWDDPTGTMNDFADGDPADSTNVVYRNNLYWNKGNPIPADGGSNFYGTSTDTKAIEADPGLPNPTNIILPKWDPNSGKFLSGSSTIRQEFERLVNLYCAIPASSPAVGKAEVSNMPSDDILGNSRGSEMDIGAYEYGASTPSNEESGSNPFSNVKPYPNPFNPNNSREGILKFINLPKNTTIELRIYTVEGQLIKEIKTDVADDVFWNGRSSDGKLVARGSYICVLSDTNGNKKSLWITVLK